MHLEFEPDAVVVVAGVPGAGKTTLIDRAVDRAEVVVLDTDDLRRAGRASRSRTVRVAGHYRRIVTAIAARRRTPVVVHSRGTSAGARRGLAALARLLGRPAHLVVLVAEPVDAVAGQLDRGRTVPPGEMAGHVARFEQLLGDLPAVARREGWASVTVLDRAQAASVERLGARPAEAPAAAPRPTAAA